LLQHPWPIHQCGAASPRLKRHERREIEARIGKPRDERFEARTAGNAAGAGIDADAVEGIMLKRRDSLYVPGRPKGPWWNFSMRRTSLSVRSH
jgi:ATP-dependent DNA ligase